MKRYLFFVPLIIACASCGDNNEGRNNGDSVIGETNSATPTATTTIVTPGADSLPPDNTRVGDEKILPQNDAEKVRLVISFISQGEGIDRKMKGEFETWLATKQNVKYEVRPWGREGELNYCFAMANMSVQDQEAFVKEVRSFMGGRSLIVITENTWCDNYQRKP
jgi:hypothetical protein